MFCLPLILSLLWCMLGYLFLGRNNSTGAIIASMVSLSMAWMASQPDPARVTTGPKDRWT